MCGQDGIIQEKIEIISEGKGKSLPYNETTSLAQRSGVVFPRIQLCEREDHRVPCER